MLERVYIDNVRTFVNFEWRPGRVALLLGPNGAGKTALFEVLADVQRVLMGASCEGVFVADSLTRWDSRLTQTIECDVRGTAGLYRYALTIEHRDDEPGRCRIKHERLRLGERALVEFIDGKLQLFDEAGSPAGAVAARQTRSAVGTVVSGDADATLRGFKSWVWAPWSIRPDPRAMSERVEPARRRGEVWLSPDLSDFGEWYLQVLRQSPGTIFKASNELSAVLPGFRELSESAGYLWATFEDEAGGSAEFSFGELSDGQRALIALYIVMFAVAKPGRSLWFDEPDNYVALREIQPWLSALVDRALRSDGPQVWLISHNPEILNFLSVDYGWRMWRDALGPTRIERFEPFEGLAPAEGIARGWDG